MASVPPNPGQPLLMIHRNVTPIHPKWSLSRRWGRGHGSSISSPAVNVVLYSA